MVQGMSTKQRLHLEKARLGLTPEVVAERNRKGTLTRMRNRQALEDRLLEANRRLSEAGLDTV